MKLSFWFFLVVQVVLASGLHVHHRREAFQEVVTAKGTKPKKGEVRFIFFSADTSQNHEPRPVPPGSYLASIPVNDNAQIATFLTQSVNQTQSKHAIIIIHGSRRDADAYWIALNATVMAQILSRNPNVDPNVIVAAPLFYSTKLNSGEYNASQLAWGDVNVWQAGALSNHPKDIHVSSFQAIYKLIQHFSNKSLFPNMQNITVAGHSGGGQVVGRLAAVLPRLPDVYVRFVSADSSTSLYFTDDRPITNTSIADKNDCALYNTWRYGLDGFDVPPFSGRKPYQYYRNYASRDVVTLAGLLDINNEGDQYCMAVLQGGTQRIQRNLAYWKYINLLGRTQNDVSNYPGNFSNLPDWSRHLSRPFGPRLVVSANWSHDVQIFGSDEGVSALFDTQLARGWRPGDSPLLPMYANISDDPPPNGGVALMSGPSPNLLLLFPVVTIFLTTFMTIGLFGLL